MEGNPSVSVATKDVDTIKFIKSLLPSLFQREDLYPSLVRLRRKRGWGDFIEFNYHLLLKDHMEVYRCLKR